MDTQTMKYFVKAAECLNFTQAAKECYISQTAMSLHISKLEEALGFPLFVRQKKKVYLTAAGKEFYRRIKVVIQRYEEAFSFSRDVAKGRKNKINIGIPSSIDFLAVIPRMRSFRTLFPDIILNISLINPSNLRDALRQGEVDLTVCWLDEYSSYDEFDHIEIQQFPLSVVFGSNHPFNQSDSVSLDMLQKETVIVLDWGNNISEPMGICKLWHEIGVSPNNIVVLKKMDDLLMRLQLERCVAMIPFFAAKNTIGALTFRHLIWENSRTPMACLAVEYNRNHEIGTLDELLDILSDSRIVL